FSSRRRHTRFSRDWSSDVCSSDLELPVHGHHHTITLRVLLFLDVHGEVDGAHDAVTKLLMDQRFHGIAVNAHYLVKAVDQRVLEIGRASCRESVKRWVMAGSVGNN